MRRFLSKRIVYVIFVLVAVLILTYAFSSVADVRERMVKEYFEHKNFLFALKNLPARSKRPATEKEVADLLSKYGLEPQKLFKVESGVEVQLKEVPWALVPDLAKELEESFELVKFSAVDNTGKGLFEVRIVVR